MKEDNTFDTKKRPAEEESREEESFGEESLKEEGTEENAEEEVRDYKFYIRETISWIMTILVAIGFALFLNHFVIVNANVPTGSMENTIMPGDRLIGWRLAYKASDPQRGDIVIFKYPINEEEIYIKRVIGLPGEKLSIIDGAVYINDSDTPLDEPYLKEEWVVANTGLVLDIPEGYYFVMGDNRNNSADGRYWASEAVQFERASDYDDAVNKKLCFVEKKKILGKALFRYFPSPKTFPDIEY